MKTVCVLFSALIFAAALHAAQETPAGKSTLKLDNGVERDPIREDLKEMASLDREIKALDRQIATARAQALSHGAAGGADSPLAATYDAQASTYAIERDRLVAERASLRARLHSDN
jgi:hypothetical protein